MNYKILERYMGIPKEDFLEMKEGGDCPHSLKLLAKFVWHIEGIKIEKWEKEAEGFLDKLKW